MSEPTKCAGCGEVVRYDRNPMCKCDEVWPCPACGRAAVRSESGTDHPPAPREAQYATTEELYNDLANELDETRTPEDIARLTAAVHALDPKNPPPPAPRVSEGMRDASPSRLPGDAQGGAK